MRKPTLLAAARSAALIAVAAVAAFGVQALALPRPSRSYLVGVEVERWLVRHRAVDSTASLLGHRVTSTCVGGWIGPVGQVPKRTRASLLVTSTHEELVGERGDILSGTARVRDVETAKAFDALELAGCPWWLGRLLGNVLDRRGHLVATHASGGYRLRLGRGGDALQIVVDDAFAPIAVRVPGRFGGWAHLRLGSREDVLRVERFFAALTNPGRRAL